MVQYRGWIEIELDTDIVVKNGSSDDEIARRYFHSIRDLVVHYAPATDANFYEETLSKGPSPRTYHGDKPFLIYEVIRQLFDEYFSDEDLEVLGTWVSEEQWRRKKDHILLKTVDAPVAERHTRLA